MAVVLFFIAALTWRMALARLVSRSPWQPILYACSNQLTIDGLIYPLVDSTTFSQYWQCEYLRDNGDGSSSGAYCWYDYQNHTLYHYPNTPLPVDSSASCPNVVPVAQEYLIKTSQDGLCISAAGNYDGAPLVIKTCDYRHGNPLQKWQFIGSTMQAVGTSKCIDVKDGLSADGSRVQVWTCFDGNGNQQFRHWVGEFLVVPEDHISWMLNPNQCLDNTDGQLVDGNPIQIWGCYYPNPNQKWYLEPVINN